MPLAKDVASELRKLADSLDKEPETEVQQAWINFCCNDKETFLNTARLMPRPIEKRGDGADYILEYGKYSHTPIHIGCTVPKSRACTLIKAAQPAVYDCLTILEPHEVDAVSA